jgi:polyisoprenoid-binding protein YceI
MKNNHQFNPLEEVMKRLYGVGISLFLLVCIAQSAFAAVRDWELDSPHSNIYFGVDHIFSNIQGHFNDFTAKVNFDPANLKESRLIFQIKVDSIDTNNGKRDKHLLSTDFFDASKYPLITFESETITDVGNGVYAIAGKLNIKGKVHDLTLPLTLAGIKDHPAVQGKQVAGFNGKITVDRLALGVGDEKFYKMGMLGKDVEIFVSFEALSSK